MNGTHIMDLYRHDLAEQVRSTDFKTSRQEPLDISPWLAMSLLQKAIRRGEQPLALRAAMTLLRDAPDKLWRRLCVTAFEDVGVADFETVALVMAGLTGKVWRSKNGGDWPIASYLIHRMCQAPKCRAADDLAYVCERHPDYEQARLNMTYMPIPELLDVTTSGAPLPERALALWYAIGTHRCRSSVLRERKGEPHDVLDALCERGFPDSVAEPCRMGLTKSGEIMAPFTALLWPELQASERATVQDVMPETEMIGGVPSWAFDMHTREGKAAIRRFLTQRCDTIRWIASHIPPAKRPHLTGHMLFRVEGGCLSQRMDWKVGTRLRHMCDTEIWGIDPAEVTVGLNLLRQDLPLVNEARKAVFEGK